MMPLKNDRYLRALLRQPVDRTPIWFMRQAGRYLPEYRALRAQASDFMSLCRDPELACEVALQPLRRFALDAAIVFSDILTIPDAMGLGLYFRAGEGPRFQRPIACKADIQRLTIPDPEGALGYVMAAVRMLRAALANTIPLIGFAGSPWTLAAYMLGGSSHCQFKTIQAMVKSDPSSLHLLLEKLADSVIVYLNGQISAGAQAIMIFDTWGGLLSSEHYQAFSLHYLHKIVAHLTREQRAQRIPVTLFTRNGGQWLEAMADTGCDALSIDWQVDLGDARRRVGHRVALQGNLDPLLLHQATPAQLRQAVTRVLSSYGGGTGHIFNLGHGIPQQATPEQVQVVVDAVQCYSAPQQG